MWPCSVKLSRPSLPLCRPFWIGGNNGKRPGNRPRLKLAWLLFAVILLLPGCASLTGNSQARTATALPTCPALESLTATNDGGISLNKHDAAELLIYIEALERATGVK